MLSEDFTPWAPSPVTALPVTGRAVLARWGVIRAAGADAAGFLQGQLTQDVLTVDDTHARLAGYCSVKGRLLATFLMWRSAQDEFLLACPADVLAPTMKRLSMFVMRAKCRLSDASAEIALVGGWSTIDAGTAAPAPWTIQNGQIECPPIDGFRRWVAVEPREASAQTITDPTLLDDAWHWLEVASGVPWVQAATVDAFVPQMVNYELIGGVSFRKGCFPGQEVVARSQYRGTLKRRMHLFASELPVRAGDEVFHPSDATQPVGTVVNAATFGQAHRALVSLKLSALIEGEPARLAHASASGAAMVQLTLPYPVPAEAVD